MRWLLTSWGSRGDLHPFLALGRGLIGRGHNVTLVGHPDWREESEAAGLPFAATDEPPWGNILQNHPAILSTKWNGLPSLRALAHHAIAPSFKPMMEALLAQAPNHDVLVAHHFVFPAAVVAERTGLPWSTVSLAPGVLPSAHTLPGTHFGRAGRGFFARQRNRFIWSAGKLCTRLVVDPAVNALRQEYGLPAVRHAIFEGHSSQLNLQLYSRHFAPLAPDWSTEKKQAGFCHYDPPQSLPEETERFLRRGDAPVLFTLGSTAVQNPGPFYQQAAGACRRAGVRGLLLIGPEKNRPAALPESVHATSYAPYGLLMPRVRAVVHQCGIGTLSHALRAGLPSLGCPFAFDQPNNARRLEELGLAEVLPPRKRSEIHLAEALGRLLNGPAPAQARRMAALLAGEDGVALACRLLEETFSPRLTFTSPFS